MIGVPLVVEATTRFALLAPWPGAILLVAFSGLAFLVSWRRELQSLAAAATLASVGAAVFLAATTSSFVPYSVVLIALGVATLWLGYHRDWFWLRWVTALVADIAMIGLTTRATEPAALRGRAARRRGATAARRPVLGIVRDANVVEGARGRAVRGGPGRCGPGGGPRRRSRRDSCEWAGMTSLKEQAASSSVRAPTPWRLPSWGGARGWAQLLLLRHTRTVAHVGRHDGPVGERPIPSLLRSLGSRSPARGSAGSPRAAPSWSTPPSTVQCPPRCRGCCPRT